MSGGFKRRAPTALERLAPCHCCSFPLSHRHHALSFADHGESPLVHSVCGACHDALHLVLSSHYKPTEHNKKIWDGLQACLGYKSERLQKILKMAYEHIDLIDDHAFTHLDIDFGDDAADEEFAAYDGEVP